jgi:hypothetical protein
METLVGSIADVQIGVDGTPSQLKDATQHDEVVRSEHLRPAKRKRQGSLEGQQNGEGIQPQPTNTQSSLGVLQEEVMQVQVVDKNRDPKSTSQEGCQ